MQAFVKNIAEENHNQASHLLRILHAIQGRYHYIPEPAIEQLAAILNIARTQIIGVIEFYSFFHLTARGRYELLISDSITDHLLGKHALTDYLSEKLQLALGEVRADGVVSLDNTSCTGLCDQGPAGLVNGLALPRLDRARIDQISELINQETPLEHWPSELFHINDHIINNYVMKSKVGDRNGKDLLEFIKKLRKFSHLTHNLSRLAPLEVIEDLALAGAFDKDWVGDDAKKKAVIKNAEKLLKLNSEENAWEVKISAENDIELIKECRGVKTPYKISLADLEAPEIQVIAQVKKEIVDDFAENVKLVKGEEVNIANKPNKLMEMIIELGKKGMTIQRFKGLGEMNAEQLWETTLDPANRTLLQVKVDQYDEADQVFSTLMGNVVEPRRDFIQENALKVVNLDV